MLQDGWTSWVDWLGLEPTEQTPTSSLHDAHATRADASSLNADAEWRERLEPGRSSAAAHIAQHPQPARPEGFKGDRDWLECDAVTSSAAEVEAEVEGEEEGEEEDHEEAHERDETRGAEEVKNFVDCRNYARSLGLTCQREWLQFCQSGALPADVPTDPSVAYAHAGCATFLSC